MRLLSFISLCVVTHGHIQSPLGHVLVQGCDFIFKATVHTMEDGVDLTLRRLQTPPRMTHIVNETFFDVVAISERHVKATVCAKWTEARPAFNICRIREMSGAWLRLRIRLIHHNRSDALGSDNESSHVPILTCELRQVSDQAIQVTLAPTAPRNTSAVGRWQLKTPLSLTYHSAPWLLSRNVRFVLPARTPSRDSGKYRVMLIGDSHTHKLYQYYQSADYKSTVNANTRIAMEWTFRFDGRGIMHNRSPDVNMRDYLSGHIGISLVEGLMMRNLNNGVYDNLQRRHAYHVWAFQSGHWDLRDQTIERYCRSVSMCSGI